MNGLILFWFYCFFFWDSEIFERLVVVLYIFLKWSLFIFSPEDIKINCFSFKWSCDKFDWFLVKICEITMTRSMTSRLTTYCWLKKLFIFRQKDLLLTALSDCGKFKTLQPWIRCSSYLTKQKSTNVCLKKKNKKKRI